MTRTPDIWLSIITPCYHGAAFLPGLHHSLLELAKEETGFEWILVDDGSRDEGATVAAMEAIAQAGGLPVRNIFFKRNYFGARSISAATAIARGKYAVILDQDDRLAPGALATFLHWIRRHEDRPDFAGVCGRCLDSQQKLIGKPLRANGLYATEIEVRHREKIRGEMFQCTRIELLRKYFAEFRPGYTNGWVWMRMAQDGWRFVYVNQVVRLYDTANPHSMSNQRRIHHPGHVYMHYLTYLQTAIAYLRHDPLQIIRFCIHCERYRILAALPSPRQNAVQQRLLQCLLIGVHPLSRLLCVSDRLRKRVHDN